MGQTLMGSLGLGPGRYGPSINRSGPNGLPGVMGWTTCLIDLADPAYTTVTRSGSRNVLLRRAS